MRSRTQTRATFLWVAFSLVLLTGCQTPLQGMMKNQSPVLGAADDGKNDIKGAFGDVIGKWTGELADEIRPDDDDDEDQPQFRSYTDGEVYADEVPVGRGRRATGEDGLPGLDQLGV